MGTLIIRAADAHRRPLPDTMDVRVVSSRTGALVSVARGVVGNAAVRVDDLVDGQQYAVRVSPTRHRPVAQFAEAKAGNGVVVQVYCPLDPAHVTEVRFPEYAAVAQDLRDVLERSRVVGAAGHGSALYHALGDEARAGLLNLFTKMRSVGLDDAGTVWAHVDGLYRIERDRVFADVQPGLRGLIDAEVVAGRFHPVDASLHPPPDGFDHAGSFKSNDPYGNLQLTFFASRSGPTAFKVDADIDDAAGLGHAFQVLRNAATRGTTHPYDIHEILVFQQGLALPYELV